MADDRDDDGYQVGYGRPPKAHQFEKGRSGNPGGRPRKAEPDPTLATEILNESVTVEKAGVRRGMPLFEAAVRKLVSRALKDGDLNAAREFLRLCEYYGAIAPKPAPASSGIVFVPKDMDWEEWMEKLRRLGDPPWPGKHSGLPGGRREPETEHDDE